jgi:citrate synthase
MNDDQIERLVTVLSDSFQGSQTKDDTTYNVVDGLVAIADALNRLADMLKPDYHPAEAFEGVATALERLADAVGDHEPMETIEPALQRMAAAIAAIAEKMINE